jgi:acyl-coenzyme A thioesterase PaaI-like protein
MNVAKLKKPFYFRAFLFFNLPSCFFWRIKLEHLSFQKCTTSIPLIRNTKNPFRSIYFAALCGTAELATGLLMFQATGGSGFSILVTHSTAQFHKKSTSKINFTCEDGHLVSKELKNLTQKGQTTSILLNAIGKNENGELIATMSFTWAVKKIIE